MPRQPITRRRLLTAMGWGATVAPLLRAAKKRPNILFIMSDDHAAHAISAYGSRINKTPNLDRIAAGGVRFNNCFVTNSICTPSRGVIMTGQYSHLNGVKTLADPLDPARDNVAKRLQAAGYTTAVVGKWHLHKEPSGFDHWNILPGQGLYYDPVFNDNGQQKKHKGYCTDLIGDFSIEWLEKRDKSKPFFLMCHHKAPHRPWQPGPKYKDMLANDVVPEPATLYDDYENRGQGARDAKMRVGEHMTKTDLKTDPRPDLPPKEQRKWGYQLYIKDYLRCVQSVDDNVGRLLDYLDGEGIANDTIVIYTSDQGFFLGDHGWFDKRFMYEESLRMPLLIRYPGGAKAGTQNNDMVLNLDFPETFLDYAGANVPSEMQGRSLRPLLEGKRPAGWRQSMYYRYWMHLADHYVPAHYGVRTKRHKLIYYYGQPLGTARSLAEPKSPYWELFDLEKDPREMKSVYEDPRYSSVVTALKAELGKLQKLYGDEPWSGQSA